MTKSGEHTGKVAETGREVDGEGNDIIGRGAEVDLFAGHVDGAVAGFYADSQLDGKADVLSVDLLLTGFDGDARTVQGLLDGGYLCCNVVESGQSSQVTVVVGIDRESAGGSDFSQQTLATIKMDGMAFALGSSSAEQVQELMSQLIANDQIKF